MNSSIFLGIWWVIKKPRGNFFALNSQGEGFVFIKTLKSVALPDASLFCKVAVLQLK